MSDGNHTALEPSPRTGTLGRVHDRATFEALRRDGRRMRRGPVSVVYIPSSTPPPRVAFAIGRSVGNAVVRNRLRRRCRAVLHQIEAGRLGELPLAPGTYLLSARPEAAALPYVQLADLVRSACDAVTGESAVRR